MKKRILIVIAVGLIGGGTFFGYRYFFKTLSREPIEAVSAESLLVFQSADPVGFWNELVTQDFWPELTKIPAIRHAESMLVTLDSLAGSQGKLQKFLKGKNLTVSLHGIGKDDLGLLFVLKAADDELSEFLQTIESNSAQRYSTTTRQYSDVAIREFKDRSNDVTLALVRIDNLVLISYDSFLVEESIRNLQSESIENLDDAYGEFAGFGKCSGNFGCILLTKVGLKGLSESLGRDGITTLMKGWPEKIALKLGITFEDDRIDISGEVFSYPSLPLDLLPLSQDEWSKWAAAAPNTGAIAQFFNFKSIESLEAFSGRELALNEVILGEVESKLVSRGFLDGLSGNWLRLELQKTASERLDRVLVFEADSVAKQMALLREFVIASSPGIERASFADMYLGKEILLVDLEQFPSHLFKANLDGFLNTYLTSIDGYLVMANSSRAIRGYLEDMQDGNTLQSFSESPSSMPVPSPETQMLWVLDIGKSWGGFLENLDPSWNAFFQKYAQSVLQFEKITLLASPQNDKHLLSARLTKRSLAARSDDSAGLQASQGVSFANKLVFGPRAIRNFHDRSLDFLVQDQTDRVYLVTEDGDEIFSKMLDGPVISDVFQIDFHKNNKLQLLFATAHSLYGLDRLGDFLPGFPISFTQGNIAGLSLVDYEGDRNYRFFLANEQGDIYLLDREGNSLEGWNPKRLGVPLAGNPAYLRVPGLGDRMFALDQTGSMHVFNRRGEPVRGVPFKLGEGIQTQYAIREGNIANETRMATVTNTGEVVLVNFQGEITDRMQLPKPGKESTFHLVKDPRNEQYIWLVEGFNELTVMDEKYQTLFSLNISTEQLAYQFFSFGPDRRILVVIDKTQEFTYLYDLTGTMLLPQPLTGNTPIEITIPSGQNEFNIYLVFGKEWMKYRLPF